MNDTFERVRAVIADVLNIDKASVTAASGLYGDLTSGSLDAVEIAMALEEEFCFEMPDEWFTDFGVIVSDIVNHINRRLA